MLLVRIIPKPFLTKMFLLSSGSNMLKEKENTFFGEKSTIQTKSQILLGILLIFLKNYYLKHLLMKMFSQNCDRKYFLSFTSVDFRWRYLTNASSHEE